MRATDNRRRNRIQSESRQRTPRDRILTNCIPIRKRIKAQGFCALFDKEDRTDEKIPAPHRVGSTLGKLHRLHRNQEACRRQYPVVAVYRHDTLGEGTSFLNDLLIPVRLLTV